MISNESKKRSDIFQDTQDFENNGFVIIRGLLKTSETEFLKIAIEQSQPMQEIKNKSKARFINGDRAAFETLFVWNDVTGQDIFSKATRRTAIFDRLRHFFNDEPYVYHNKIALKYPGVEGFRYHQDYFYWYEMGNLYPDMATAQIAIDPCTKANGCLKVISGSHKMGRLEHSRLDVSSDSGVDVERLIEIKKRLKVVEVELDRGDVVIFHANLLHASDDNLSDDSRLTLLGCYNTRHNSPFKRSKEGHPDFSYQGSIDCEIKESDLNNMPDFSLKYL